MPAGLVDVPDALLLGMRPEVHLEDLREADHRVQRCPQLVTHARQELALRVVGALGLGLRALQRFLRGDRFGDVALHDDRARRVPAGVEQHATARFHRYPMAVDVATR